MSTPCKALDETPILVQTLAATIGTSPEDACHSLEEYDQGPHAGFGLRLMLDELVATG